MTKKKNDDAFNETIIKGKTSKDMEKHINRLLYGTDYPKVYDKPEDEAKIDPEGFFPKDLYTHGTASQVIELIQEHRNRIAEALPKLRKGEYFDEALASSRALVKRVYEGTYDIYSGTENSIEWLRRKEILKKNAKGKLELDKAIEFQWLLLQCLIACDGMPGEYTWAILMKVFAGMQVRFPGMSKQSRMGLRAQIGRIKKRSSSKVKKLDYTKEDIGHLQYKANKKKSGTVHFEGDSTEELALHFNLPELEIQRMRKEEERWQKAQKKDGKKNQAELILIIAQKTQKIVRYVRTFKKMHGFIIDKKLKKLKEAKDKLKK